MASSGKCSTERKKKPMCSLQEHIERTARERQAEAETPIYHQTRTDWPEAD